MSTLGWRSFGWARSELRGGGVGEVWFFEIVSLAGFVVCFFKSLGSWSLKTGILGRQRWQRYGLQQPTISFGQPFGSSRSIRIQTPVSFQHASWTNSCCHIWAGVNNLCRLYSFQVRQPLSFFKVLTWPSGLSFFQVSDTFGLRVSFFSASGRHVGGRTVRSSGKTPSDQYFSWGKERCEDGWGKTHYVWMAKIWHYVFFSKFKHVFRFIRQDFNNIFQVEDNMDKLGLQLLLW